MVNWIAVIVLGIASMVLGALWYSPLLFGKQWMKLSGKTAADMKKAKQQGMMGSYLAGAVSSIVMAYVIAVFVDYVGAATFWDGAIVGFLGWLGFTATVTLGGVLWEKKPFALYFLNNAFNLISMAAVAGVLAVWV